MRIYKHRLNNTLDKKCIRIKIGNMHIILNEADITSYAIYLKEIYVNENFPQQTKRFNI